MKSLFVSLLLCALLLSSFGCDSESPSNTEIAESVDQPDTLMPDRSVYDPVADNFESEDGLKLTASYWDAPEKESSAVLFLHQWGSDRRSFDSLGTALRHYDIAGLAIDGRGFGGSVKTKTGETLGPDRSDETVKKMLADVDAATKFLASKKNIDDSRIGIVGASYGSSLALMYAAQNKDVKAVVLLSPGLNYFGNLPIEPAIKEYGDRPLLMLAAEDDKSSADAARNLKKLGTSDKYVVKVYPDGGHGTDMMRTKVDREQDIIDFLKKNL